VARPVTAEAIVETRVISIGWIVLHKRYQNQQLGNVAADNNAKRVNGGDNKRRYSQWERSFLCQRGSTLTERE